MADNTDIEIAVKRLAEQSAKYVKPAKYYAGDHDLQFATDKFKNTFGKLFHEFSLNMCPAVCDAMRDKLTITGFSVEEASGEKEIPKDAWKIWQENRMGVRSRQIHREAVVNGDAYAIVWVDANQKTTIYPNRADSCTVFYDEETPGKVLWGAKYWVTSANAKGDTFVRLNLFYADRIERYISSKKSSGQLPKKMTAWTEFKPDTSEGEFSIPNPYGRVPIFHFGNNADIGSFGHSELSQAFAPQDALNKSVLDMMVAMEFASFRQRWAAGIEIEYDADGKAIPPFTAGVERLWTTENPETKFGDFDATDLEQFLKVKDGFRTDVAMVTGTPLHYFMLTGASFPQSGISIEKLESRFLAKVRDRMEGFGQVWEDLISFALKIENKPDVRLFTEWEDPAPLSEKEQLDNLVVKQELGIPEEQLWIEAGYGEDAIEKMQQQKADAADAAVRSFNKGDIPPLPGEQPPA
ncbi:MAG TPA: phage portal protein [Pyrinomonadaceae bacterium]|jgi:hypothetical protein|nr:phage portal protein [Pyrinomonadaceae bacterium]